METTAALATLELFNEKADKLYGLSFTRAVFDEETGFTLTLAPDEPAVAQRRGPDEEAIDAFVLTFRFFCQNNEAISLYNMATLYEGIPVSDGIKSRFSDARTTLNDYLDSATMFALFGETLTNRRILYVFLYGALAHADPAKRADFERWTSAQPLSAMLYNQFVAVLTNYLNCISYVRMLNDEAVRDLRLSSDDQAQQ